METTTTQPAVLPPQPPRKRGPRAWQVGLLAVAAFGALLAVGMVPRMARDAALAKGAHAVETQVPLVMVGEVKAAPADATLDLPGELRPYQEAALYARTTGYLKRRLVDIGDRVKAGQLLADIESPELERELSQARAALAQLEARVLEVSTNRTLAGKTADRWKALRKDGSVAPQEADERQAAYAARTAELQAAKASVAAARQNVGRLESLTRFERVVAPFSGVITARGADPGALIGQGGANAGAPLFRLVQADRLRIAMSVPQTFAPSIHKGMTATVIVRELAKPFTAKVVRMSGAIDPGTRTLATELEVRNDGTLIPGMYARVKLDAKRRAGGLTLPGTAIVTRGGATQVAVVGGDLKVHYRPVTITRDDGVDVEVADGVRAGDRVVIGPSDEVAEGATVEVAKASE